MLSWGFSHNFDYLISLSQNIRGKEVETRLALSSWEHALDFMGLEWHSEWQRVKVKTDQTNIKIFRDNCSVTFWLDF